MDKKSIGQKIRKIRGRMTLAQFVAIYNATHPANLKTDTSSVWKYENGQTSIPAEKYEKFLSMG